MKTSKGFTVFELLISIVLIALIFSFYMAASGKLKEVRSASSQETQVERTEKSDPNFTTACYRGVLYFTTRNSASLIEYPTTPVISVTPNPDSLRPTTCQ